MNPLDLEHMKQEAQNLDISGTMIAPPAYGTLDGFGPLIPQQQQSKLDSKGRLMGQVVMCDRCRARNVTLYKLNGYKYCKKCKKIMEEEYFNA